METNSNIPNQSEQPERNNLLAGVTVPFPPLAKDFSSRTKIAILVASALFFVLFLLALCVGISWLVLNNDNIFNSKIVVYDCTDYDCTEKEPNKALPSISPSSDGSKEDSQTRNSDVKTITESEKGSVSMVIYNAYPYYINYLTAPVSQTNEKMFSVVALDENNKEYENGQGFHYSSNRKAIKLGDEIVKILVGELSCDTAKIIGSPNPVVSKDGSKVYYIDPADPTSVMEMDTNKVVRKFFTPPAPYKYVASIAAINSANEFAFTLLEEPAYNCAKPDKWKYSKSAFYINSKVVKYTVPTTIDTLYEAITHFGDAYFVTHWEFVFGGGAGIQTVVLRKLSDGSLVEKFNGAYVIYGGKNYVLIIEGNKDTPPIGPENANNRSLVKLDLNTGKVDYILPKTFIRNITLKNDNKLVVTYGGYLDATDYKYKGESRILEYQL